MKRSSLAIILACCMMSMTAQDGIRVHYKGPHPTITDFAWVYFNDIENEEESGDRPALLVKEAWVRYQKGLPQEEGVKFTLDEKNGYVSYEQVIDDYTFRMEMCYWNENDGKHKLFAFNDMASFSQDGPLYSETSQLTFLRYDDSTRHMTYCDAPGFDVYDGNVTYSLPQTGKDIIVTRWNEDGSIVKTPLKWNGHKFIK